MWFTDPSDPSTVTVLLLEVALLGLALAAGLRVLVRPARWVARSLAVLAVVVGVGGFAEVVWELWTFRYPLVLPDVPFGTHTQPTVLGLAPLLLVSLVVVIAGVLAFWRPGIAGVLFVASALTFVPTVVAPDPTYPAGTSSVVLVAYVLPLLDLGALLLGTWWGRRGGTRHTADARRFSPNPTG